MEQFRHSNLLESQHSWFGWQLFDLQQLHNIAQHCTSAKKNSMRILMLHVATWLRISQKAVKEAFKNEIEDTQW
jgi:hypothetical protein